MISCLPRMRVLLVASALPLAACSQTKPVMPPEYSANYTRIPVATANGRVKKVTVAEACLRTDESDPQLLSRNLPPGCANAHNLQLMAESERDLHRGRRMGAAPAAPSVRAAQKYLYGEQKPLAGAVVEGGTGVSNSPGPGTGQPSD